jgi:uncharacterized membrane protein YphA (DoxX/SURF4 family)
VYMNTALWIVQGLLAALFFAAGAFKVTQYDKANKAMSWVRHVPRGFVTLVGVLEVLAAIGLVVPWATGVMPWLTPLAALGLVLTMIGAIFTHIRLHEAKLSVAPLVLGLLAAYVAWGRCPGH